MLVPFTAKSTDVNDADSLFSLFDQCRGELDAIRQDIDWGGGDRMQVELEQRLRSTADQLEQAIGHFIRLQRLIAEPPASRAAAPILAREAEHRVKNGLTTVIGLLQRQAATTTDDAVGEALRVAGARVAVVAQMHVLLSDITLVRGDDREIALDAYLSALTSAILSAMSTDGPDPVVRLAVEPLSVTPNAAQTLGLIVSELVTNALRHAFPPGRPGTIDVTGNRVDGAYLLAVRDNGRGLSEAAGHRSGLGLRLVRTLADQLHARLIIEVASGTRVVLLLDEPVTA